MRKLQLLFLLGSLIFATGCPKYRPKVDFNNPSSFIGKLNAHIKDRYLVYECYRFGRSTLGSCSGYTQSEENAQGVRNELLEEALPYIDSAYIDFITDIQAGRDRDNFVADLVELGATGAVGIVNGQRPLNIIGVALTAFRGGRRSADLNFYKEQTTPVLITKMDGNRAKVRATILAREKLPTKDYPMGAAIADIVDYYNAGTLVRAFTELQKDTAVQTKQSEDVVLQLKGVPITGETTVIARNTAVEATVILRQLREDLNDTTKAAAALTKLQNMIKQLEADTDFQQMLTDAKVKSSDTDGVKIWGAIMVMRRNANLKVETIKLDKINQAIVDNGK
jgi:hypothetical protein